MPEAFDVSVTVTVASRRGCDPSPVDPATEEGRLTLTSSIWADHLHRLRHLRLALEVARRVPVEIDRAAAGRWLADRLAAGAPGVATVVFHSVVARYLDPEERRRLEETITTAGSTAT